jgi:hypothetical protein
VQFHRIAVERHSAEHIEARTKQLSLLAFSTMHSIELPWTSPLLCCGCLCYLCLVDLSDVHHLFYRTSGNEPVHLYMLGLFSQFVRVVVCAYGSMECERGQRNRVVLQHTITLQWCTSYMLSAMSFATSFQRKMPSQLRERHRICKQSTTYLLQSKACGRLINHMSSTVCRTHVNTTHCRHTGHCYTTASHQSMLMLLI